MIFEILCVFLMFFIIVGITAFWAALIYIPADIARKRGYSFLLWILYSCILTLPALIHVYFFRKMDADGMLHNAGEYKCPHCGKGMGKAKDVLAKAKEARGRTGDEDTEYILKARCPECRKTAEIESLAVPPAPSERGLKIGVVILWIVTIIYVVI